MAEVFLGLGSNMGNRQENIENAVKSLSEHQNITVLTSSSIIETEPVGYTDQPNFLNAVIRIETSLNPRELLKVVLDIENNLGRKRTIRWGPRVIDIDILLYDDQNVSEDDLQIPHPRMLERSFVLKPLAEIAPDIILSDGRTAAQAAKDNEIN